MHEMLTFTSSGVDFDVAAAFGEMVGLLRKIEIWWFENLEMAIDPETYPENLDLEEVIPVSVWRLQMLIDVALGPEKEARKYYVITSWQTQTKLNTALQPTSGRDATFLG